MRKMICIAAMAMASAGIAAAVPDKTVTPDDDPIFAMIDSLRDKANMVQAQIAPISEQMRALSMQMRPISAKLTSLAGEMRRMNSMRDSLVWEREYASSADSVALSATIDSLSRGIDALSETADSLSREVDAPSRAIDSLSRKADALMRVRDFYLSKRDSLRAEVYDDAQMTYDLKKFKWIKAGDNADVLFTQGKECSVRAVGPKRYLANSLWVEGDTLKIEPVTKKRNLGITVYVSAPELRGISVSGSGSFQSSEISAKDISIEFSGSLDSNIPKIAADSMSLTISGQSDVRIPQIKCRSARVSISNNASIVTSIEADSLVSLNAGIAMGRISFKGERIDIKNQGGSEMTYEVDCKTLSSYCDGLSKLKLSGTADNTRIKSDGSASTDTSGLNNL